MMLLILAQMNNIHKESNLVEKTDKVMESISRDRTRTNLLRKYEQRAIVFLVQRIPLWVSSNMLTAVGLFGNVIVYLSFVMATYIHKNYLLLGIIGFVISWFGDSLDGRVAYYRNRPRKWYGFALDISIDWVSIILIGCGYIIYTEGLWEFLGYGFVVMYGWEMIISLMKYKITGKYSIDSGILGPTEARVIVCLILIIEVLLHNSIGYSALIIAAVLFSVNISDTVKLLQTADDIDRKERSR